MLPPVRFAGVSAAFLATLSGNTCTTKRRKLPVCHKMRSQSPFLITFLLRENIPNSSHRGCLIPSVRAVPSTGQTRAVKPEMHGREAMRITHGRAVEVASDRSLAISPPAFANKATCVRAPSLKGSSDPCPDAPQRQFASIRAPIAACGAFDRTGYRYRLERWTPLNHGCRI